MTQLENVTQELNLIQFGFMKLNNTLQILHSSKSDEDLIKQMQDEQIELFNEFTLKIQKLRGDFLSNLEGLGMLLDEDYNYKGRRTKRGLFISSKNELINADLNGSYNIMRKVVPNVFTNGIEDVVVHPRLITI